MASKKAINKSERQQIIIGMVVDATKKSGNKLATQAIKLHADVGTLLQESWTKNVPELSSARQLELLQYGVLQRASLHDVSVYLDAAGEKSVDFFSARANTPTLPERRRDLFGLVVRRCHNTWVGKATSLVVYSHSLRVEFAKTWCSIPRGFTPNTIVHPDSPRNSNELNNDLFAAHAEAIRIGQEMHELLFSAWSIYEDLELQLAPVKTVDQLLALIPEAAKYLPDSLRVELKTKELADPTAINEIRAKLKKGLPV